MRKLLDNEKEDVKRMYDSKWFQIMESLLEEYKHEIFNDMLTKSLWQAENIELITGKQNKYAWARQFIDKVKSSTNWVGKRDKIK